MPSISITSPSGNEYYTDGETINLEVQYTNDSSNILKLVAYCNSISVQSSKYISPNVSDTTYTMNPIPISNGSNAIRVELTEVGSGSVVAYDSITVYKVEADTYFVRIDSPQDGYILDMSKTYPITLNFTIYNSTSSDNIVCIQVYIDNEKWGSHTRQYAYKGTNTYTENVRIADEDLSDGEHALFIEGEEESWNPIIVKSDPIKIYKNALPPSEEPGESGISKTSYIGINNTARAISNIYIGVNGKARKVKKAYIGVNNIARLWYNAAPAIKNIPAISIEVYSSTSNLYPNKTYSMEARIKPANCTKIPSISTNLYTKYGKATIGNTPTIGTDYVSYPITIQTKSYGSADSNDYIVIKVSSNEDDSENITARKDLYMYPKKSTSRKGYTVKDYEILTSDQLCKVIYTDGSIRYFEANGSGTTPDGSPVYTGYYVSSDPDDTTFKKVYWDSGVNYGETHYF